MPLRLGSTGSDRWPRRTMLCLIGLLALLVGAAGAATIRVLTEGGALLVDFDNPNVQVSLDGNTLKIIGDESGVIRLTTGPHLFQGGRNQRRLDRKPERA